MTDNRIGALARARSAQGKHASLSSAGAHERDPEPSRAQVKAEQVLELMDGETGADALLALDLARGKILQHSKVEVET